MSPAGLEQHDAFREPWAQDFPDAHASSDFVDLFYMGSLVCRSAYVSVDGGRSKLPLPAHRDERVVPARYSGLVRLIDHLDHESEYDDYFQRAGFRTVDEPWPQRE